MALKNSKDTSVVELLLNKKADATIRFEEKLENGKKKKKKLKKKKLKKKKIKKKKKLKKIKNGKNFHSIHSTWLAKTYTFLLRC